MTPPAFDQPSAARYAVPSIAIPSEETVLAVIAAGMELCAPCSGTRGIRAAYLGLALIVGVRTINLPRVSRIII
jgi:hypothetical protein